MTDRDGDRRARGFLHGIRVLEIADELGEYCGKVLAGLGAEVIKIEPPAGERTRGYGPFYRDQEDPEHSLHFWHYNHGKKGIVLDLDDPDDQRSFRALAATSAVLLETRPRGYLDERGIGYAELAERSADLIHARITPFGDTGPWADFAGSDLVHLALGGVAMNCGYDPDTAGVYDTPPIAPQMWQAYQITGEMAAIGIVGALHHRRRTGLGQRVETAVHQAVSGNTETDVPNWVYQRREHHRQTCRHSMPSVSLPALARTKDGRWLLPYRTYLPPSFGDPFAGTVRLLARHGMQHDLEHERYADPEYRMRPEVAQHVGGITDALVARCLYERDLWREAQDEGLPWAPCRRPEENLVDEHWAQRETFCEVEHPELERSFPYVGAKWYCEQVPWTVGPRAPRLGEHTSAVLDALPRQAAHGPAGVSPGVDSSTTATVGPHGAPFALEGVRVIDLSWMLASAGAGRFLAAMGADVIKVEHDSRVDGMRHGVALAPDGGREQRDRATAPIDVVHDGSLNRSGAFMEINAGKRAMTLNLKSERGRELLTELLRDADMVVEGFSPGTMERMGFGYEQLKAINPRIVYVQQSGMGQAGTYGRLRSYGPTAAAITGISEMSGLPDPFPPAGIGYSYLDWFGAYNMALAMLTGLYRQRDTGEGCWIDSSQAETGIFLTGTAILDHAANGREWSRTGNRSPSKPAAPHGIYPAAGDDRWIAVAAFSEQHWQDITDVLGLGRARDDPQFSGLAERIAHQDELDELVGRATSAHDPFELMQRLQARGVPAGVCQTARDRCDDDPQLAHLGWMVELEQTEIGRWPVKDVPVHLSRTPMHIGGPGDRHGPSYGQDGEQILRTLLGLETDEITKLAEQGVI